MFRAGLLKDKRILMTGGAGQFNLVHDLSPKEWAQITSRAHGK